MLQELKQVKADYLNSPVIDTSKRNEILLDLAMELELAKDLIVRENQKDLTKMKKSSPKYDRLELTTQRVLAIAQDLRKVAELDSPLDRIISEKILDNDLRLQKISVPLGIIGIIYEARPNVTIDVFSLCFKSGNSCILKGGSEAKASNEILVSIIHRVLKKHGLSTNLAYLMPAERKYVHHLLEAVGIVDVCIPRGSQELINFVRNNAKVPVIETGAGVVHIYFDASGNLSQGRAIINNAKTRRVSVCNALDTLVIHHDRLSDLPELVELLALSQVEIFADPESYAVLNDHYPKELLFKADANSFGQEFLDYKMAVKTAPSFNAAVSHIMQHTSGHSEAIIAQDQATISRFMQMVDAAAVYANASTAFTDGGEFGLGAEIGISTQKLHARGPMGLNELTSYKWLIWGNGQIR